MRSRRKAPWLRAGTSAAPRPKRCARRSRARASASRPSGRFVGLRFVDPADLARLRAGEAVAHLAATVDALRKLLAPRAAAAFAERLALVVLLQRGERFAKRRHRVADAVGADVAGGVLPRERRLRLIEQPLAGGRKPQAHDAPVDVVLESLDQSAAV